MPDIQLSDDDRAFIEREIRAGEYRTVDEVVSAGLQALRDEEAELRLLIQKGEDDIKAGRLYEFGDGDDLTAFIVDRANGRLKKAQQET